MMEINNIAGINRSQKILLSLYKISGNSSKQVRFEDIAVEAFINFPTDFQLRGYPQYPDAGDIIHKPLYVELKKAGYILSGNKYFSLTPKGIEFCKQLTGGKINLSDKHAVDKLSAVQQKEIERIKNSSAFKLFATEKRDDILDIDFYAYLGVTVRTDKHDFLGRLNTVEDAINSVEDKSGELYSMLNELHQYLMSRFKENISYFVGGGKK